MEPGSIVHPGVIEKIQADKILVKILSQSACSTCHARGACSVSEVEEKIIEISRDNNRQWNVGEQVMVKMEQSLGLKAVFLGYLAPLLVLIASVIVFLALLKNEGWAALLSIGMLGPYYLILWLIRNKLRKRFRFRIEEAEE